MPTGPKQRASPGRGTPQILAIGEALAGHRVNRVLGHSGGSTLARAEPLAVVDQATPVRGDVDRELVGRAGELAQVRVVGSAPRRHRAGRRRAAGYGIGCRAKAALKRSPVLWVVAGNVPGLAGR